jgi:hypothetical protein
MKTCTIKDCSRRHYGRGLCKNHYQKTPKYKAKRQAYYLTPESRAYKKAYHQTPAYRLTVQKCDRKRYSTKYGKQQRRAYCAKRKATKLQRTPSWANLAAIRLIYETCPIGHHVDHIVPLQGKNVSGLHVEWNLQHLPAEENLRKSNKF